MKEIIKDYIREIKDLLKSRKYLYTIIFIAILSFGFAITHYAIGVDDLCFDRYVKGTYILSAKRWGTWALYNILNITEFSPFWLDFLTATGIVIIAILVSAFIKKETKEKNIMAYIVFSGIFISSPLINNFFLYQSTNFAIVVSNIIVIICGILIYYNCFEVKKKRIYPIVGLILTISLSMYESCAQTFIVFLLMTLYIRINKENLKAKEMIKYVFLGIASLAIGVIAYAITGKILLQILEHYNLKQTDYAGNGIYWYNELINTLPLSTKIEVFKIAISKEFGRCYNNIIVTIFALATAITMIIEIIQGIKNKQISKILIVLGIILTNFILIFAQAKIMFRTQFSWILTITFEIYIIYKTLNNIKYTKHIVNIVVILMILMQSRQLSQLFYNDYKRYEKDKVIANEIAIDLVKETNYKEKYIVYYTYNNERDTIFSTGQDNGTSIISWGVEAFDELATEITDFINSLGYEFLYPTGEMDLEELKAVYESLDDETKEKNVIELEDYIIVNLDKYELLVEE